MEICPDDWKPNYQVIRLKTYSTQVVDSIRVIIDSELENDATT